MSNTCIKIEQTILHVAYSQVYTTLILQTEYMMPTNCLPHLNFVFLKISVSPSQSILTNSTATYKYSFPNFIISSYASKEHLTAIKIDMNKESEYLCYIQMIIHLKTICCEQIT